MGNRPKVSFSTNMGGNSSKTSVVDEKLATKKEEIQKITTESRESEVIEKVKVDPTSASSETYDFRKLAEPEKTFKRLEAFLLDKRFTHGEHAAGSLLILAFRDKPDTQLVPVRQILSDERGYSGKVRNTLLASMAENGLIEKNFKAGVGTEITMLF